MNTPLPGPTLELLADMRAVMRYVERVGDLALTVDAKNAAREHAAALRSAIERVDELAQFAVDLAMVTCSTLGRES